MTNKEAITELLKYKSDASVISDEAIYLAILALRKTDNETNKKNR